MQTTDIVEALRNDCGDCGSNSLCRNGEMNVYCAVRDAADRLEELLDRCARYAEEIAVLRERQRWIPVTERLPEDDGHYLCCYRFEGGKAVFYQTLDYYATDVQPHFQHEGTHGMHVTHWMPLPKAPEVE